MKKKFGILIAMLFVSCILAFCVSAKVVSGSGNTSKSSACQFELSDTILIKGSSFSNIYPKRYYTFSVPYSGYLIMNADLICNNWSTNSGEYSHNYWTSIDMTIYNASGRKEGSFPALNEGKRTHSVNGRMPLTPGNYYLEIWNDYGSGDCTEITLVFDFECGHYETEENIVREASCSEEGYIEEICSECGEVADEYEIDRLDHTPESDWTVTKEATCAGEGERVKYCTVCGEEAEVEEITAQPHDFTAWKEEKAATCEDEGSETRECLKCGYEDEREIDPLGHDWGKDTVIDESTCEKEGLLSHTCEVCGKVEKETIEKKDHRFESWKTTKDASESSTGKKERTCKDCDYTEEETIPKLACGDEYEWVTTTKATCTSNGTKKKVCDYCGKTLSTQTIYAEGHEWGSWKVTKIPTKTSNGLQKRECEICGKTEEKTVTLTHGDYGEWKVTKEATCEETGKKEFVCYCCSKVTDTETIKKTGHSYGEWTVEQIAMPDKEGKQTAKCKNCDETKSETIEYDFEELKKASKKAIKFTDVKPNAWYRDTVENCYHYGLMVGTSETTFNPSGDITRAEVITSAVRIYCLMNPDEKKPVMTASPWYQGYVDFAISKGIIKANDFDNYTVPATRAEMAYVFANAVEKENLEVINKVTTIPDVKESDKYGKEIFSLYNAGVLTGNDEAGTFAPERSITRAESATIIARISKISDRVKK